MHKLIRIIKQDHLIGSTREFRRPYAALLQLHFDTLCSEDFMWK